MSVLRFDDLRGKPLAFWVNYAVHVVVMGPDNYQITGDRGQTPCALALRYNPPHPCHSNSVRACCSGPNLSERMTPRYSIQMST